MILANHFSEFRTPMANSPYVRCITFAFGKLYGQTILRAQETDRPPATPASATNRIARCHRQLGLFPHRSPPRLEEAFDRPQYRIAIAALEDLPPQRAATRNPMRKP